MKRVCLTAALSVAAAAFAACAGNTNTNPVAPSPPAPPPAAVVVRSVSLSSTATSSSTFQMNARAEMSDGSSRDATTLSRWDVSDPSLAIVSSAGVLNVLGSGQVEVRATYENVTGAIGLLVSGPPRVMSFAVSGVAMETAPVSKVLSGVRLQIVEGPDAGQSTVSDANGAFRFPSLKPGTVGIDAAKDGYVLWRVRNLTLDRDRQLQAILYPTPPTNAEGVAATARCNDGSWSWATSGPDACAANNGIAYTVCPGALCALTTVRN